MFVLNRKDSNSHIDESTKNTVRSIFNENVCKLLDKQESKIEL